MFEIGDNVILNKVVRGKIVGWYYDEGNMWIVRTNECGDWHCCDNELVPA